MSKTFTPPRGLQRLRFTRRAVFFYHRRFTVSFCWSIKNWHWRPEFSRFGADGGWAVTWGRHEIECYRFGLYDDWGVMAAEIGDGIFSEIAADIKKTLEPHTSPRASA